MTKKAIISTAELKRMAAVAKSEGVTVEVEAAGLVIRIKPYEAGDGHRSLPRYEDFDL